MPNKPFQINALLSDLLCDLETENARRMFMINFDHFSLRRSGSKIVERNGAKGTQLSWRPQRENKKNSVMGMAKMMEIAVSLSTTATPKA